MVDILLNLKGVVLKLHNRDEVDAQAARRTAKARSRPPTSSTTHDVEIINPDHVIAHLTPGGKLDMQIKVEKGRGYVPAHVAPPADEPTQPIGRILLDASFSPVRRVSYAVESARVEQRTDLDKLVIDIETNGVIEPEEAIRYVGRVLVEQLSVFAAAGGHRPKRASRSARSRRSTRSCCARSTTSSSRCARPTASRPRTSTTSAT